MINIRSASAVFLQISSEISSIAKISVLGPFQIIFIRKGKLVKFVSDY